MHFHVLTYVSPTLGLLPDDSVVLLGQFQYICISTHQQCCEYKNLLHTYTILVPINTHNYNEFNLYKQ